MHRICFEGLGQLVDGLNHTIPGEDRVKRWIGWHDSSKMNSVELVFEFDYVRTFGSVDLTVDNDLSKEVEVFKIAEVTFSTDGQNYSYPPICYHHFLNDDKLGAQTITLDLNSHKGKFAKLNFYFKSKWIYLSEVKFKNSTSTSILVICLIVVSVMSLVLMMVLVAIWYRNLKRIFPVVSLKKVSKLRDNHYNEDDYLKPREDQNTLDPMYETLDEYGMNEKHKMCYNELRQVVTEGLTVKK